MLHQGSGCSIQLPERVACGIVQHASTQCERHRHKCTVMKEEIGSYRKLEKPVVRTCSTAESPGMTAAKGAARGNTICGFLRRCALTCRLFPEGFLQHQGKVKNG